MTVTSPNIWFVILYLWCHIVWFSPQRRELQPALFHLFFLLNPEQAHMKNEGTIIKTHTHTRLYISLIFHWSVDILKSVPNASLMETWRWGHCLDSSQSMTDKKINTSINFTQLLSWLTFQKDDLLLLLLISTFSRSKSKMLNTISKHSIWCAWRQLWLVRF